MIVYIVLKNNKVDAVFDNLTSAEEYAENLRKRWNFTLIKQCEVYSL